MSDKVQLGSVTGALSASLGETFEGVKGFYLDPDESLLKTLEAVSAATASKPISQRGTSIAAHVAHARFYLVEIVHASQAGPREVDWDESWKQVAVDAAQ